jgi:hypothetical protein
MDYQRAGAAITSSEGCCGGGAEREAARAPSVAKTSNGNGVAGDIHEIVDYEVTMLIAAGAAMAANCEMCLDKIVPDLIEAGVAEADIRRAVEIGQFVKDKPAAIMKEAADTLTGSRLSQDSGSGREGCPADEMKRSSRQ